MHMHTYTHTHVHRPSGLQGAGTLARAGSKRVRHAAGARAGPKNVPASQPFMQMLRCVCACLVFFFVASAMSGMSCSKTHEVFCRKGWAYV